ncbi:restriction endonuclease subunit S [Vibrio cholerae]|nr:restriction endonuclease subunit S [Vibrio cholerae]ELO1826445.1 restriction endonuclease subunit S [Vibrio cholerae]
MSIWIETKLKESEIGKIPLDWSCTTLNKIADINPKPIKLDSDYIEVSFVGMADVSESAKLMNTTNRLYGEVKKGFTSFQDNDVLVAKITPCFENGKGALVSNLTNGIGFGSTEFHVIRTKEQKGCPEFIHHITTTHNFRVKGEMNMTGTAGQKRVGKDFIASYLIACPPFVEQQKIAEILSTVDKKIDLIDQKIAETEKLKTGLMQKLFSEGVGVQDENGEWQPHTEFQDSIYGNIPKTWKLFKLNQVTDYVDYRGKTPPKVESGTFLVTAKNIKNGFIDYECSKEYIPSELYDDVMSRGKPKLGDVVFTTEAPLGNVALIDRSDVAIAQRVIKFRPKDDICLDSGYLKHFMLSTYFQKELLQNATGSTVLGVKGKRLHVMLVCLPSINEQIMIVDILNEVDRKMHFLELQKAETQQLKKGLMQKLLTGEWRVPVEETEAA